MRISDWSSDVCSSDLSEGFEIETEISVHALELKMPVAELRTAYGARPEGSASKLSTYRDGWRILKTMINLYRIERPIAFFGADRKSDVSGQSVYVRVDPGGRRIIKKKKES